MLKVALLALGSLALVAATVFVVSVGPRNVVGMLRYDTRREGKLKVGDRAPDVALLAPDGTTPARLVGERHGRPLVLVFGSFT